MTRTFVIGARGSALSRRQVEIVVEALRRERPELVVEVRVIKTEGDRSAAPLSEIGGAGVFTKAIEDAVLARDVDIAVHSLKDLPPLLTPGLVLGATPERGDVRDALVTRGGVALADLPSGARIGTGSARRAVQLKALRPDIEAVEIRGNVPTRIAKVESGEFDAAALALAGLERLGLAPKAARIFSIDEMTPAVGQGALGVEVRADDTEVLALVSTIDHRATRATVTAERAFLERLGAGCKMPIGAYAQIDGARLAIRAMIEIGGGIVRPSAEGDCVDAAGIGARLGDAVAELMTHA